MRTERIEKLADWLDDQAASEQATARILGNMGEKADPKHAETRARLFSEIADFMRRQAQAGLQSSS